MRTSIRKMDYEKAYEYGRELIAQLREREDYRQAVARAEEMGIKVLSSIRHTYTEEYRAGFRADPEQEGRVPVGYSMELWFDLARDWHVLAVGDGSTQCSYGAPAIDCMNAVLFHYLNVRDLDEILARNPIAAMIEEFLDGIEEHGEIKVPFTIGGTYGELPEEPLHALTRSEVTEGNYVELARGVYTGEIGGEDSLYFTAEAFRPYVLFLHGLLGEVGLFEGATLVLDADACEGFASLLDEAADVCRHAPTFADIFMEVCESPLAPPPQDERIFDHLTVCRDKAFAKDCETLAAFLREQADAEDVVTVIW